MGNSVQSWKIMLFFFSFSLCVKYWIASFSFLWKLISGLFTWVTCRLTDLLGKLSTASAKNISLFFQGLWRKWMKRCLFGFYFRLFVVMFNQKFGSKALQGTVDNFQMNFWDLKVPHLFIVTVLWLLRHLHQVF